MTYQFSAEQIRLTKEMMAFSYTYRGQIIGSVIYVERGIDEALSRHFCADTEKASQLFETILATKRIGFHEKVRVFQALFKEHQKEFMDKHSTLIDDLDLVIKERNNVAHNLLDTSPEGIKKWKDEKVIGFIDFAHKTLNKKETIYLSEVHIKKILSVFPRTIKTLEEFLG